MCTVVTGLHLTGLGPAQQATGLAQGILSDTVVVSTWPKFLFRLECKHCCTACILKFVLNMASLCLHPYYEMVVLRMQDSLPFT